MARSAQITFGAGEKVRVEHDMHDTKALADRLAEPGQYLYLNRKQGGSIFVNGNAVAYVEDWPD